VVLRYRDGRTVKASLDAEFSPQTRFIEVFLEEATVHERVGLDQLKAVFFVKDQRQREADMSLGETADQPGSALARVEFSDGEIMRGRVSNYSLADAGFYLYPTAADSNHHKVFVVAAALTTLAIEG
jgi:hypothetical protein